MNQVMKTNYSTRLEKVSILKDIFSSTNEDELFSAFSRLNSDISIDKTTLEADFNRYFIGPDAPLAAPYSSIYIDRSDAIMTETTQKVRNLYDVMGFENKLKNSLPEDFLGLELDAYYQLLFIEEKTNYLTDIRCYFLFEHIKVWVYDFIEAVLENKENPSLAINFIVQELKEFFDNELKYEGDLKWATTKKM